MGKDTCIKANTYCPVCRGITGTDCWHSARDFSIPRTDWKQVDELSALRTQNAEQAERIRELEGKNDGFNELTGLMQKSLEEDTTRIGELSDENQQLRAALASAMDEFENFTEYWNGDSNYSATTNALNYIECKARKHMEQIDALLYGRPVEDPRDAKIASLQAKIDALMLEYCPDEITLEQMEEWASHQVVCEDPRDKVIEAANNLYKAVQAFRNDDYLGRCHGLRRTQTYSALCDAWDEMREQFEALAAIEQLGNNNNISRRDDVRR